MKVSNPLVRLAALLVLVVLVAWVASRCGRKPATEDPAALVQEDLLPAPGQESPLSRTAVQERMEDPVYVQSLLDIQTEQREKSMESEAIQERLVERTQAIEAEHEQAIAIRAEMEDLQRQMADKEESLMGVLRQDPEWARLDAELKDARDELEAIRLRALSVIRVRMQEQAERYDPTVAGQDARFSPSRSVQPQLAPPVTELTRIVVTSPPPRSVSAPVAPPVPAADGAEEPAE